MNDQRLKNQFYREREIELNNKALLWDRSLERKQKYRVTGCYFVVATVIFICMLGFAGLANADYGIYSAREEMQQQYQQQQQQMFEQQQARQEIEQLRQIEQQEMLQQRQIANEQMQQQRIMSNSRIE